MSKKIWKWVLDNLTEEELRGYAIDLRVQVPGFRDVTQSAVHSKRSILVQKLLGKVAEGEHLGPKRDVGTATRSIEEWQERLAEGADPVAVLLDILATDEADAEAKAAAIFADLQANPRPRSQVRPQAEQKPNPKPKPKQRAKPELPLESSVEGIALGDTDGGTAVSLGLSTDGELLLWKKKYEASQTKVKELRGQLKEQTQRSQELYKETQTLQRDLAKAQREMTKATTQGQGESHVEVELLGLQTVVSRQESLIEKQTVELARQTAQIEALQVQLDAQVAENGRQVTEITELRDVIERARYAEAAVSPVAAAFAKAATSERVVRGRGQTRVRTQATMPTVAFEVASLRGPQSDIPSVLLIGKQTAANLDLVVRSSDFTIEFMDVPNANERILETGDVAQYDQIWILSYEVGMRLQGKMERLVPAHRVRLFDNHFELLRYMGTREARERE